ncbi:uncharacterized protein LOC111700795 isoform X3 [Eurytemora carolleeae]|uniref:uncharacterized protein LOC111700795 isoform X3 n=1 Tax=Eurytemora carolleeae TaxID=1294199 RepID=UPI000C7834BD|nr:uncharacterized protein LOC111700795 isoform X3 [Eurytemora carolleeae]|eukprot:XP_023327606.1 uncharacterized protein LOC111700795 isoform X3 [Eurytemora affinis]
MYTSNPCTTTQVQICTHPTLVQQLRYRYVHTQPLYNNLGTDMYTFNPCTTTQVQICTHPTLVQQLRYRYVNIQSSYNNLGTDMYTFNPCTTTQVQICTHPTLVQQLRDLLTGCIRKHIITPHNDLPEDKPLALVVWECRLLMSSNILYSSRYTSPRSLGVQATNI